LISGDLRGIFCVYDLSLPELTTLFEGQQQSAIAPQDESLPLVAKNASSATLSICERIGLEEQLELARQQYPLHIINTFLLACESGGRVVRFGNVAQAFAIIETMKAPYLGRS